MFKRSRVSAAALLALGGVFVGTPSLTHAQGTAASGDGGERVVVTGSRILRSELQSSSPMVTIPASELVGRQDVTLDTVLNTLPQVNPAGGTTSNNPGNGGQSNIDLRGLGSNRNLVLIDGRRPMVSASDQTVDLNTIPMALIDSIEVITGGAGAVYGADAVAGVVNIKLRKRFQGLTLSAGSSQSTEFRDGRETRFSIVGGTNFEGNRGNASLYFDYSKRDALIKGQRAFAAVATSTTSFFPEGSYRPTGNNPTQAAIDALFSQASYRQPFPGQAADPATGLVPYTSANVPTNTQYLFNSDGSLIPVGIFNNNTVDVRNWRYPVDLGVNSNIFPDLYSYNFDAVNLLVLPLQRYSMGGKIDFTLAGGTEVFGRYSFTRYKANTALAPTPIPTINIRHPALATATQGSSTLVVNGTNAAGTPRSTGNNLVVPVTNPFIPADLAALLASRTGDNVNLVGSGATEPFLMRWRSVPLGLRLVENTNEVMQALVGAKGDLLNTGWTWEAYASYGETKRPIVQTGNLDTNRLQRILEAPDGGNSLCAGGVNPFGRQAMSADCIAYLSVEGSQSTTFKQKISQAFVAGDVAKLSAGSVSAVVGAEIRDFSYDFKPGSAAGPISGFNVQNPAQGTNNFTDIFGELQIPLVRRAPFARSLDLSLAARTSQSEFEDKTKAIKGDKQRSNTYAMNLTWEPSDGIRARGSLQRSVRAPNFGELFDGGSSAPQYFDPCSASTVARRAGNAGFETLCSTLDASGVGGVAANYQQTPGSQSQTISEGNPLVKPERGTSVTLGLVFVPGGQSALRGFSASVDYYQIKVKDAIVSPDPNEIIADCYNFYGANPSFSLTHPTCQGINRAGSDIFFVARPGTAGGNLQVSNGGVITTSGIDIALGWAGKVGPGQLSLGINYNHLLEYKLRSASYLPEKDYTGTIPYFGAGFGQAFPSDRVVLTTGYKFGDWAVDARYRWFSAMSNRMALNFPGESFTGTAATGYLDLGASVELFDTLTLRVGLNNALDQKPRTYAPNVQSGTDPSTFDVVGRRLFVQATAKF